MLHPFLQLGCHRLVALMLFKVELSNRTDRMLIVAMRVTLLQAGIAQILLALQTVILEFLVVLFA
jgi:hypothetical protein